jgi:hypothetical protein
MPSEGGALVFNYEGANTAFIDGLATSTKPGPKGLIFLLLLIVVAVLLAYMPRGAGVV